MTENKLPKNASDQVVYDLMNKLLNSTDGPGKNATRSEIVEHYYTARYAVMGSWYAEEALKFINEPKVKKK